MKNLCKLWTTAGIILGGIAALALGHAIGNISALLCILLLIALERLWTSPILGSGCAVLLILLISLPLLKVDIHGQSLGLAAAGTFLGYLLGGLCVNSPPHA